MRYEDTQIGKLLEQVKLAMLSNTPIVYIPTQQIEVIQAMLFSEKYANSIIPRMGAGDGGDGVKVYESGELFINNNSVTDNYMFVREGVTLLDFNNNVNASKYPVLFVQFIKDNQEWNPDVTNKLFSFVCQYLGIKSSAAGDKNIGNNYIKKELIERTKQSLCIVVSPRFIPVPSQLSLYTKTVFVEPISDNEIEEVISSSMRDHGLDPQFIIGKEKLFKQMKVSFRGMSALKIQQLMQQMIKCQYIDFDGVVLESVVSAAIQDAKKELLNNCLGLKWEKVKQNEAAGLDKVVDWLTKHAPLFEDPEKAIRQHVDIPKGVLITGIPGSGKSLMAMTAARLLNNMPLISLNMGLLRGSYVGQSERNLETALRTAENMAPCVLWIDEIEKAMSGSSGDGNGDSGVGQRMLGTFLTWLQEKSSACFVFATSNDITHLPSELFRSERFDRKYFTFMPKAEECAKIFASIIKSQNETYSKELDGYDKQYRKEMSLPQQLFDADLQKDTEWLEVLNTACTTNYDDCIIVQDKDNKKDNKDGRYVWKGKKKPSNKLLSGADISSIIKEAKFKAIYDKDEQEKHHDSRAQAQKGPLGKCFYEKDRFLAKVREVIKEFKPYGETDLINLAKCFYNLNKNQVESASGSCILDFGNFDEEKLQYVPSDKEKLQYVPSSEKEFVEKDKQNEENRYNIVLFNTLVGAINHYLPLLDKKGKLS